MTKLMLTTAAAALLLGLQTAAHAQMSEADCNGMFTKADFNNDGTLGAGEVDPFMAGLEAAKIKVRDAKVVTLSEFVNACQKEAFKDVNMAEIGSAPAAGQSETSDQAAAVDSQAQTSATGEATSGTDTTTQTMADSQAQTDATSEVGTVDATSAQDMKVDLEAVSRGLMAEDLIGKNVYGAGGEEIGEIENILVNTDAQVTAIIVEAGGFLDIGDTHFRVPFSDVDLTPFKEGVKIPIDEERAERWGLFDGDEVVWKGPREFRITELIGDYVRLQNGAAFGNVDDVVLDPSGKLLAVVVNGARPYGYGLYAYPFYGYRYGFDPGLNHIVLPIDTAEDAMKAPKEKQQG